MVWAWWQWSPTMEDPPLYRHSHITQPARAHYMQKAKGCQLSSQEIQPALLILAHTLCKLTPDSYF